MLPPILALAICAAYIASLWWLLRREAPAALVGVVALTGVALAVRVWSTDDYPAGLIEDEPKMLRCAMEAAQRGQIANGECVGMPLLFWTLFQAQLVPILGPTRWAVRTFSLVTSVLSVPAAYAVGRGLTLAVAPSLGISALVACLPWSIFFGRIALGGELVFHQLLLLAALARLVFLRGAWVDILVGSTRPVRPPARLLLRAGNGAAAAGGGGPGTRATAASCAWRWWCSPSSAGVPYLMGNAPSAVIGLTSASTNPGGTLWTSTVSTLRGLVPPAWGRDSWFTVRWASVHPPLLLTLAAVGSLTGVRRGLLLWAAFLGGLVPVDCERRGVAQCAPHADGVSGDRDRRRLRAQSRADAGRAGAGDRRRRPGLRVDGECDLYFSPAFWPMEVAGCIRARPYRRRRVAAPVAAPALRRHAPPRLLLRAAGDD